MFACRLRINSQPCNVPALNQFTSQPERSPPAFNLPGGVIALIALIAAIHFIRSVVLSPETDWWVINVFAFVPYFYEVDPSQLIEPSSRYWSPVSHGLLHGDWGHLLVNTVWMAAFGSAVARRLGSARFIVFMILATAAGAVAHYIFHASSNVAMIGASGAVSACMGAAVRFAFAPGQSISAVSNRPALSLVESLKNRNTMVFVVFWFAFNWLVGSGILPIGIGEQIAWEAHMGGFVFGWIAFTMFDPVDG